MSLEPGGKGCNMEERPQQYGFDSCGALDLSSAASASSGCNSTKVSDEESSDAGESRGKRSSEEGEGEEPGVQRKRMRGDPGARRAGDQGARRRNIREVLDEERLAETTRAARASEEQRLLRLSQQNGAREEVISTMDDGEILFDNVEEEEEEDPNNSGMHVNDALNVRTSEGRVLVNTGHSRSDPDLFLAPQLAEAIKPHQIGGVRFLYDNIVESVNRFSTSQGYGCILAHSMGLGETTTS